MGQAAIPVRILAVLAAVVLLSWPALASAALFVQTGPIPMEGQAQVAGTRQQPQLLLSADATDGSGYHLEAALSPATLRAQRQRSSEHGEGRSREHDGESDEQGEGGSRTIGLKGQFTLSGPDGAGVAGDAAGQVDPSGTGSLTFNDTTRGLTLQADFTMDDSGNLALALAGQLPARTASPAPTATAASSAQASAATAGDAAQPSDHTFWYVTRAAGLTAYLLLFVNVCLGLAVRSRFLDAVLARWRSFDLHQFTALLAMAFLGLHGVSLLADHYIGFTLQQVLVPLASSYRPLWTALGVIGSYILVLVMASSYLRKYMGYGSWRALHYLSFGAYVLALVHGITAGTDSGEPWARWLYWTTGSIVAVLMLRRFSVRGETSSVKVGNRHPADGVS